MTLAEHDSESFSNDNKTGGSQRILAPAGDRFLAFALDFCLWFPLILLPAQPLWKKAEYYALLEPSSLETIVYFVVASGLFMATFVLAQALMIWKWTATPGKKIMRLQVVPVGNSKKLTFGAAFLRSSVQIFELCLFAIPFLEVLSQDERRPWHDRLAETLVITTKNVKSESPHWIEMRFFRNLYWGAVSIAALTFWGLGTNLVGKAERGIFKRAELQSGGHICRIGDASQFHPKMNPGEARLDYALALYQSGQLSRECLESEANFVFWSQTEDAVPWAHLIRGVLAKEDHRGARSEVSEEQFLFACPVGHKGEVCQLAKWYNLQDEMSDEKVAELFKDLRGNSWTGKAEYLKKMLSDGRLVGLKNYIENESWPEGLFPYLQESALKLRMLLGEDKEYQAIYGTLGLSWDAATKADLAAWSCWAESIAKGCSSQKLPRSCDQLKKTLRAEEPSSWSAPALLSLKMEANCANRQDAVLEQKVEGLIKGEPELAWVRNLGSKGARTVASYMKIAEQMPRDHWASSYLLADAVMASSGRQDLERLGKLFNQFSKESYSWWVAFKSFEKKSPEYFTPKVEKRISVESRPE